MNTETLNHLTPHFTNSSMDSLEKYTTEELELELKRRSTSVATETQYLCVGIIDDMGTESLVLCENGAEFAERLNSLQLRARFNAQRNPIVYCVKMPRSLFTVFDSILKRGDFESTAKALKELSNFKILGY